MADRSRLVVRDAAGVSIALGTAPLKGCDVFASHDNGAVNGR